MGDRAYYRAEDGDWCEYYDMLKGPDDFECLLTEPEDRNWWRDGREVVTRLNEQHDQIQSLTQQLAEARALLRGVVEVWDESTDRRICDAGPYRSISISKEWRDEAAAAEGDRG